MPGREGAGHLEVEVGNVPPMHVGNSLEDLLQELDGLCLHQRLLLGNEVKELPTADPESREGERVRLRDIREPNPAPTFDRALGVAGATLS